MEKAFGEKVENINIFIGPEGGFSEQEIEKLNEYGILSVHMGKRILRADTAAYSAVFYTAMRYELNRVNQ
ncbi:MAG: Ribosomal RNA small subunit methyltransferase E [Firmicutes bacterium ADurb.Bin099]|nr:MAG: Ribosomal RNA small subunit methyltransferase E [Firmicutes bacterium ADurb.Bin099]